MKGCGQFLATLVAFVLVVTAVLALFVVNLAQVVTDRDYIKQTLNFDQILRDIGTEMVLNRVQLPPEIAALIPANVDLTAVQTAFDELVTPDWIDQQADGAVDNAYDFLETGELSQATTMDVDVSPILQRLRAEPGRNLIVATLESLPPCETTPLLLDPLTGSFTIPDCRPVEIPVEQVADVVHAGVVQLIDANPQLLSDTAVIQVPLLAENALSPQQQANLQRAHQLYVLAENWAWLLWLPPAFCLFLLLVLVVRSVGQWGRWWGWPLLLTGIFTLFIAALLPAIVLAQVRLALPNAIGPLPPTINVLLQDLAAQIISTWLGRVYLQAGIALVLGIVLVIIGYVFRPRPAPMPTDNVRIWS